MLVTLHHHYGVCKTLLPQLLLSTKNLTSREVKTRHLFDQKKISRLNPLQRMI